MRDQDAIRRWFYELTEPHGTGARLSKATGLTQTQISRMRNLNPTDPKNTQRIPDEALRKAARFFGSLPPGYERMTNWLPVVEPESVASSSEDRQEVRLHHAVTKRAAVDGKVEAGSWRMVDDFDQSERRFIDVPSDEEFPNARIRVYEVAGDSMDAYERAPIRPGSLAVCLDYEDVMHRMPKRDGMVVVVERSADGGQFRERSIKEIEIHDDRIEFHPRSNNPEHKPIVVPIDYEADDGVRVQIVAVLRRIITETIRF